MSDFWPQGQMINLQGDAAVYASLSAREEAKVVTEQIVAASLRQCTCSQRKISKSF